MEKNDPVKLSARGLANIYQKTPRRAEMRGVIVRIGDTRVRDVGPPWAVVRWNGRKQDTSIALAFLERADENKL